MNNRWGGESQESPESEGPVPLSDIPLHSTNLLTLLDENGIIQYESPSVQRLYGYEQNDLVGDSVADYFHPDDREKVVNAFEAVVASDEYTLEAVEYRHLCADGTYLWVESVAAANPTPDGYYVINTRDISVRKQYERDLEQANKRLEEFVRFVSHDLRNPLAVAKGSLELAEEDAPSNHHSRIADALERMEGLIDGLLRDARGEIGEVNIESIGLANLSETCWRNVATTDATLVVETDQSIRADPSRVMQLLENLYRNATEHGGKHATVTVGGLETGFYIEDDGGGIPEEARRNVFEAGYSTSSGGTGLGLSIVQRVAEAHGWEVQVTEGAAGGARFEITGVEFTDA